MSFRTPLLATRPAAGKLPAILAALGCSFYAAAEVDPNTTPPDKSGYSLFRPTPKAFLRELSPDRPDKTDSPFTVDAGHVQLEMDFVNLTYNEPNAQRGNVRFTSAELAPMNLKVGLRNDLDFQLLYKTYRWDDTDN